MRWKHCLVMIIISLLFTQLPVLASAAKEDSILLAVNGVDIRETAAYKRNDITYIPFRAVFKSLGIPFDYDATTHIISYTFQDEHYSIDIEEQSIITPDGGYYLSLPLLTMQQRTYIPQRFVEDLLRLEVEYDKRNNKLLVNSLDYAYNETINSLVRSYYNHDIPASSLFTYDANPYGPIEDLYSESGPLLKQVINTTIGAIKFKSTVEAVVLTSKLSTTPAVTINQEVELHLRKEGNLWKINKINPTHLQIALLDDVEEKVATLLHTYPDEVEKVLNDLRANYDALQGNDVEAAIKAYSPLYIDEWNQRTSYSTWEEIVEHSITFPSDREDLLEAKVIHIDGNHAAVYVKILFTELPQTYAGLYEPHELEDPYEYEEILYLDYTNWSRWTFNNWDPINQNY